MSTWHVTISALRRSARESQAAQQQLQEAKEIMKAAAGELSSKWIGDASVAFTEEQAKLDNWFTQLIDICTEYIDAMLLAADDYEEKEEELASKVNG